MIKDKIADQLIYSTARIISSNSKKSAYGTGFFMLYTDDQNVNHLALVTNRHVVSGYTSAEINLVDSDEKKSS